MVLSKTIQKRMISKRLNKMGVESDLIDVHAYTDSKLGLRENWDNLKALANPLKAKPIYEIGGRSKSASYSEQAEEIHANRSQKAKQTDNRIRARKTFSPFDLTKKEFKKWKKRPNRYDIEQIDTYGF